MRFARAFGLVFVLALVLAVNPARAGAQDNTARSYDVIVGHVVNISWTASVTPGVLYNVYVSSVSGGPYIKIGSAVPDLQFSDLNATAGNTYYYVVTAFDSDGESDFSGEVSATIPTP